jgi:hypothetical protein
MPGAPIPHTEIAAKGHAIAEMLFAIESARALYYRAISEGEVNAGGGPARRGGARHRATGGRHGHPGGESVSAADGPSCVRHRGGTENPVGFAMSTTYIATIVSSFSASSHSA